MDETPKEINVVFKENYSVESFLNAYDISRRKFYKEVHEGNITIYKVGVRTFVTRAEAQRWLEERVEKACKKVLPQAPHLKPKD